MGVKSLWNLLTPVGRPVMYVVHLNFNSAVLNNIQVRDNGGQDDGH